MSGITLVGPLNFGAGAGVGDGRGEGRLAANSEGARFAETFTSGFTLLSAAGVV